MTDKFADLVGKKRKEATQQEKRQLAKQLREAKKAECQSWIDNEVFDLADMRKTKVRNFVAGLADGSSPSKRIKTKTSKNVRPEGS